MIIGIVGKSGSGKSFIASQLKCYSERIVHLDIDKIGHKSHQDEQVKKRLVKSFGPTVIVNDQVDRKKLASIVFTSKEAMAILENITWAFMEQEIDEFIANNQDKIIILDWLLLPRTKYFKMLDYRILVTAPLEVRVERAIARDNISREKFIERDNAAIDLSEYDFDYTLINIDKRITEIEVKKLYDKSIIHR